MNDVLVIGIVIGAVFLVGFIVALWVDGEFDGN